MKKKMNVMLDNKKRKNYIPVNMNDSVPGGAYSIAFDVLNLLISGWDKDHSKKNRLWQLKTSKVKSNASIQRDAR